MSAEFQVRVGLTSRADETLFESASRGRSSLAFFTRSLRGARGLSAQRLDELQLGDAPRNARESEALETWFDFRAGRAPRERFARVLVAFVDGEDYGAAA